MSEQQVPLLLTNTHRLRQFYECRSFPRPQQPSPLLRVTSMVNPVIFHRSNSSSRESSPDGVFESPDAGSRAPRDDQPQSARGTSQPIPTAPIAEHTPVAPTRTVIDPQLLADSDRTRQEGSTATTEQQKRSRDESDSSSSDSESEEDDEEPGAAAELAKLAASLGLKPETQYALKMFTHVRVSIISVYDCADQNELESEI